MGHDTGENPESNNMQKWRQAAKSKHSIICGAVVAGRVGKRGQRLVGLSIRRSCQRPDLLYAVP